MSEASPSRHETERTTNRMPEKTTEAGRSKLKAGGGNTALQWSVDCEASALVWQVDNVERSRSEPKREAEAGGVELHDDGWPRAVLGR